MENYVIFNSYFNFFLFIRKGKTFKINKTNKNNYHSDNIKINIKIKIRN